MAWVTNDFVCEDCGEEFTEFYKRSEKDDLGCPECESKNIKVQLCSPNLATFSLMTPEQRVESMKRRSAEHTQKEIDKEPERWGEAGVARRTKKIQV